MTSWILSIDKDLPEHWDAAAEAGFWDLTTRRCGIRRGDYVYFWQSKHGLVGWTEATADERAIDPTKMSPGPWSAHDDRKYVSRVEFALRGQVVPGPSWSEIKANTGITTGPNFRPRVDEPAGEAYLRALFTADGEVDDAVSAEPYEGDVGEDLRIRTERSIATRRGQPKFREALLRAYRGQCAITGCTVESVLEAAHIDPYRGAHSNHVQNGLLLRADIHTLFDLHLVTVDEDLAVRIAPQLCGSEYEVLAGRRLAAPREADLHPDAGALQRHRVKFENRYGRR